MASVVNDWIIVLAALLKFLPTFSGFNLDIKIPIVKLGNPDSYFGFSVAQHFVYNPHRSISDSWVLVGAPRDNITDYTVPQSVRNVVRPGAVYKCPFTSYNDDCTLVKIDQGESHSRQADKNDQWLGVSVASQATDSGKAVACAHRSKRSGPSFRWGVGVCISMTNDLEEDEYWEPCNGKPTDKGHGQYGFCQAGASTAISKEGDLLIGAPGPFNWRGAIIKNSLKQSFIEEPKWFWSAVEDVIPNVPGPEPAVGYYSYLGISVKVGNIINGRKTYVAGAPRSRDSGQVLLFQPTNSSLKVEDRHYLTGEQFGSCFGYDIAIADFNSDGRDDLAVGAPFYHDAGVGGAIYVFLNSPQGITKDTKPLRITNRKMKDVECAELNCINARFGFALSSIGDINRDGYADLAVGAPYEGNGAVYVFHGSSSGIVKDFSQRISASDLPSARPLTTFGYSLSGGEDLDINGYPDLVVGAFDSNKIVVLRSRPIINVNASFVSTPTKIDPNLKRCLKDNNRKNNCFELTICFKYTAEPRERYQYQSETNQKKMTDILAHLAQGISQWHWHYYLYKQSLSVPKSKIGLGPSETERENQDVMETAYRGNDFSFGGPVHLDYKIEAENFTGSQLIRVFFKGTLEDDGFFIDHSMSLRQQNVQQCSTHMVFIKSNNQDFLNAIQFRLTYKLRPVPPPVMIAGRALPDINSYPILDDAAAQIPLAVNFLKNCVHDSECLSNLNVNATLDALDKDLSGDYILRIGQTEELRLDVIVGNQEEEAHETMLYITLPPSLSYIGTDERGKKYSCIRNENIISCSIGNPLHSGHLAKFAIRLDPNNVPASIHKLNISVLVNTTSKETNLLNDLAMVKVKVIVEADIGVLGKSTPREVFFSGVVLGESAIKSEDQIGAEIIHSYEVKNLGGGRIANSTLVISWPYEKEHGYPQGKHLLYLMEYPRVEGQAECIVDERYVNRLKVSVKPSTLLKTGRLLDSEDNKRLRKRLVKRSRDDVGTERTADGRIVRVVRLDCDGTLAKCHQVICNVRELHAGQSVVVDLRFRLWHGTFLEDYTDVGRVYLSSKAEIKIDPSLNVRQMNIRNDKNTTTTVVQPSQEVQVAPGVDLWIIIVSVCVGIILLILLIVLLWKCGFFKRNKPDEMAKHKAKLESQKQYPEHPD